MEEVLVQGRSSSRDKKFDAVIGHIEDIVVDEVFQEMQMNFMDKHCDEFDDSEENKLSYTPIFNEYVGMLEKHIESELLKRIPRFDMTSFMKDLASRKNSISEEILELLISFTDFLTFKQLILDHKAYKEGKFADFSLTVTPLTNFQAEQK